MIYQVMLKKKKKESWEILQQECGFHNFTTTTYISILLDHPLPEESHYLVEEGAQLVSSEVSDDHTLSFSSLQPQSHQHASCELEREREKEGGTTKEEE